MAKRNQAEKLRQSVMIVVLILAASFSSADTIYARPVAGTSSTTTVGLYNSASHETTFYIPLSQASSGIYGVGGVGTVADTGSGYGYGNSNTALTMYLLFDDPYTVVLPVQTATLSFQFTDLDLVGVNDPAYFFESVQFFSKTGTALTSVITSSGQTGSSPLSFSVGTVGGDPNVQQIYFSNITSIIDSPFYVQMKFDSQWNQNGTNTPENMVAKLVTTSAPVPEPATITLLGAGSAVAWWKRRKLGLPR